MNLHQACVSILDQLIYFVNQVKQDDFCLPIKDLTQSTVGQHVRHILEFFICLQLGYEQGIVNYDKRKHDKAIETDKSVALEALIHIKKFVEGTIPDKNITLEFSYDKTKETYITLHTNYMRELAYNIEHAIHHMAIIKIAASGHFEYITLPKEFGVAVSTLRHEESTMRAVG